MNNGNGDFENLKKLLKLKRHEQPPPRYFSEFSGRVLSRIEAGEQAGFMTRFWNQFPSLERLRFTLEGNPISAGIFAVCGMLVVGFAASQYFDGAGSSENLAVVPSPFTPGLVAQNSPNLSTEVRQSGIDMIPSMMSHSLVQSAPDSLLSGGFNIQPVSFPMNQ